MSTSRRAKQIGAAVAIAVAGAALCATSASALPPPGAGGGGGGGGDGGGGGTPPRSCTAATTKVTSVSHDIQERDKTDWQAITVDHCQKVVISASGNVTDGFWFHGYDGPQGWVGNPGGSDYPLPGAWTNSVIAKWAGSGYFYVGAGISTVNNGDSRTLYIRRNDNVPGNGSGSFHVDVDVYRP